MKRRGFMKSVGVAVGGATAISRAETETEPEAEPPDTFQPGAGVTGAAAPIVFDPEILDILHAEAPILGELPLVEAGRGFESDISGAEVRELVDSL